MPILTAPFNVIPASNIPAAQHFLPYPGLSETTELNLVPRTNEEWSIEGLSLTFALSYEQVSQINVASQWVALKEQVIALQAANVQLAEAEFWAIEAQIVANTIFTGAPTNENKQKLYEAIVARESAKAAVKAGKAAVQAAGKELAELGVKAAQELTQHPPFAILARVYARGGELLYNEQITPVRVVAPLKVVRVEQVSYQRATVVEYVENHVQFQDPIVIGEREGLRLSLQFIGPPEIEAEGEGQYFNKIEVSPVSSIVNYTRREVR
jgi:hypothetical protein